MEQHVSAATRLRDKGINGHMHVICARNARLQLQQQLRSQCILVRPETTLYPVYLDVVLKAIVLSQTRP